MDKEKMKKIGVVVLVVAAAAYFILINKIGPMYTGNFILNDGHEWTEASYEVIDGEAEEFSLELKKPTVLKVVFDGDLEFSARVTLKDAAGETMDYIFHIYEQWSTVEDMTAVVADLEPAEE